MELTLDRLTREFGPKDRRGPRERDARARRLRPAGANGAGKTTLMRMVCGAAPHLRRGALRRRARRAHG